jgi:hypothetical protein
MDCCKLLSVCLENFIRREQFDATGRLSVKAARRFGRARRD